MTNSTIRSSVLLLLLLISASAHAYVGPGVGIGILGTILGGIMAVLLAIFGVIWYPIKRLFSRKKSSEQETKTDVPKQKAQDEDDTESSNEA